MNEPPTAPPSRAPEAAIGRAPQTSGAADLGRDYRLSAHILRLSIDRYVGVRHQRSFVGRVGGRGAQSEPVTSRAKSKFPTPFWARPIMTRPVPSR
jgi:hypothetical protein